jgi:hypothetical protein
MPRLLGLPAALVALVVLVAGGGLAWSANAGADPPAGATIVGVRGDRDTGFAIVHYDGRVDHPPTLSEGRAECGEYARRVERVRCRTGLRVWYRELGRLKRALEYAHSQG